MLNLARKGVAVVVIGASAAVWLSSGLWWAGLLILGVGLAGAVYVGWRWGF